MSVLDVGTEGPRFTRLAQGGTRFLVEYLIEGAQTGALSEEGDHDWYGSISLTPLRLAQTWEVAKLLMDPGAKITDEGEKDHVRMLAVYTLPVGNAQFAQ